MDITQPTYRVIVKYGDDAAPVTVAQGVDRAAASTASARHKGGTRFIIDERSEEVVSTYRPIVGGKPVRLSQVTDAMLAPVRAAADRYRMPQTIWPSRWVGADYQGEDCLLAAAAAPGLDPERDRPSDAAEGAGPFLTVLPAGYLAASVR